MTTQTLTLTDFLLARIMDTEVMLVPAVDEIEYHGGRLVDARDLVKIEAETKRRIVEQYEAAVVAAAEETDTEAGWIKDGVKKALSTTLLTLALPYADHPDYREEWKP